METNHDQAYLNHSADGHSLDNCCDTSGRVDRPVFGNRVRITDLWAARLSRAPLSTPSLSTYRKDRTVRTFLLEFIRERDPLQSQVLPVAWVQALEKWIPRIEQADPSSQTPLVIQGQLDGTVDWQHNMRVLEQKFANPKMFFLPKARHHLANEDALIRREYLAWLAAELEL